jgi:hypothetical protein
MSIGIYTSDQALNFIKGTDFPSNPTLTFGLHNGDPSNNGANEITSSVCSGRASYSGFDAIATVGSTRQTKSSGSISWGTSTAAGNASYWSMWSGSNYLWGDAFRDSLGNPKSLVFGNGDTISTSAGSIALRFYNDFASNYFADMILGWLVLSTTPPTAPTDTYIGLATAVAPDGTITEVTTTIRPSGRMAIASTGWTSPATDTDGYRKILHPNNLNFGDSAGAVTGLQYLTAHDAASSGNLLARITLTAPKNVILNEPIIVAANTIGYGLK